ncbi:hypothetical protein BC831DRAFT_469308 [Entophlyctis helioformis]|nr:hypothetical protein BC831DRAFT_469308 [Entophlyctis helioformis]
MPLVTFQVVIIVCSVILVLFAAFITYRVFQPPKSLYSTGLRIATLLVFCVVFLRLLEYLPMRQTFSATRSLSFYQRDASTRSNTQSTMRSHPRSRTPSNPHANRRHFHAICLRRT